jgi:hypothetical protein
MQEITMFLLPNAGMVHVWRVCNCRIPKNCDGAKYRKSDRLSGFHSAMHWLHWCRGMKREHCGHTSWRKTHDSRVFGENRSETIHMVNPPRVHDQPSWGTKKNCDGASLRIVPGINGLAVLTNQTRLSNLDSQTVGRRGWVQALLVSWILRLQRCHEAKVEMADCR